MIEILTSAFGIIVTALGYFAAAFFGHAFLYEHRIRKRYQTQNRELFKYIQNLEAVFEARRKNSPIGGDEWKRDCGYE